MAYYNQDMIEGGIEQLRITACYIAYPGVKRSPVVAVEEEMFLDKEVGEVGLGSAGPVVVSG